MFIWPTLTIGLIVNGVCMVDAVNCPSSFNTISVVVKASCFSLNPENSPVEVNLNSSVCPGAIRFSSLSLAAFVPRRSTEAGIPLRSKSTDKLSPGLIDSSCQVHAGIFVPMPTRDSARSG